MTKSGSGVASKGSSDGSSWDYVGVVNGRIAENGSVRERKCVSKTFGSNRGGRVHGLFGFCKGWHPWRCSGGLNAVHTWR